MNREISTFWAGRIRWGLKAGITPEWWPVLIFLPPTRRAFDHSLYRRGSYSPRWVRDRIRDHG